MKSEMNPILRDAKAGLIALQPYIAPNGVITTKSNGKYTYFSIKGCTHHLGKFGVNGDKAYVSINWEQELVAFDNTGKLFYIELRPHSTDDFTWYNYGNTEWFEACKKMLIFNLGTPTYESNDIAGKYILYEYEWGCIGYICMLGNDSDSHNNCAIITIY